MKTLYHRLKFLTGFIVLAMLAVSCLPETESMGDAGQTLVKITPDGFTVVALDPVSTPQSMVLFEVRRDVPNSSVLNSKPTTVVLNFDADTTLLKAYNEDNETEFIPLPPSLHTTTPALSGNKITMEFGPGEYVKPVMVNIPNAFNFDFSKQYALTYTLTSVSGEGKISAAVPTTVIAQVLAKNKYDGKYEVTALSPMVDVLNSSLTGYYPFIYELETTGEHTVACLLTDPGYYTYYHPILSGTSTSAYGGFGLEIEFAHDGSGEIIAVYNPWGNPPANTRMPVIDPSGVNKWDASTGNISFKYFMIQPSLVPDPPHIRVYFDEYWTYKGPR